MSALKKTVELPLLSTTPEAWGASALADPIALLIDHAFLEMKAALNAMDLLTSWPISSGAKATRISSPNLYQVFGRRKLNTETEKPSVRFGIDSEGFRVLLLEPIYSPGNCNSDL